MTWASWTAALRSTPVSLSMTVVVALGCAATPSGLAKTRPSLLEGMVTLVPHQSPARWVYHPRTLDVADLHIGMVEQHQVLLTRDGQRWIDDGEGNLLGAEQVAPEPLVAVAHGASEDAPGWSYLGRSGTTYESLEPLGPFARVSAPPERLARVTAQGEVVLGVTARGTLIRSGDSGATWDPIAVGSRVADVVLLPAGAALLLTSPEGFASSEDSGAHFKAQNLSTFGAMRLSAGASDVRVEGVLGARRWSPEHPASWLPDTRAVGKEEAEFASPVMRPSAVALREGRALLHEGRYVEVVERDRQLTLLRGAVSETLESTPLSMPCPSPHLDGRGRVLYLVCGAEPLKVTRLEFFRSKDGGDSWEQEPYVAFGDGTMLGTAVLGEELLVTGVCPPAMAPSGCQPSGVYVRGKPKLPTKKRTEVGQTPAIGLVPVAVPGLQGVAHNLSVSPFSETLLVMGTRKKSDALVLFSSQDGGRTFRAEEVEDVTRGNVPFERARQSQWIEQTMWGQDGYAAVTVVDSKTTSASLLIINEQGELVQRRTAPSPAAQLAGVGLRALAVEPRSGAAWESTDGGNRWQPVGEVPVALCAEEYRDGCDVVLVCHEQGCLLGEALSRVGWGGQQDVAYAGPLVESTPAIDIVLQTPISCRINDDSPWHKVPGGELPDASRSSLGQVDWFTHHIDWDTASVSAYEVALDGDGALTTHTVFDTKSEPSKWVLYATGQTEGVAALRAPASGAPVEVAWRNLNRSRETYRRALPSKSQLASAATKHLARAGKPGLVSIAAGGVFVRLGENEANAETLLLDHGTGMVTLPPLSWPSRVASGRTEMVQVQGAALALKLFSGGAAIVGAALDAERNWQVAAFSAGLANPIAFGLRQSYDLAYLGGQPHYHVRQIGASESHAWLFPLLAGEQPLGESRPAPSQRALKGAGEACSIEQRRETARVLAPPEAGSIHPVVISHSSEPFRAMITRTAVLYGSADEPCLAGFEAENVSGSSGERVRALVRPEPSETSWLFRRLPGSETFEYRSMSCERDSGIEVPAEVYDLTTSDR